MKKIIQMLAVVLALVLAPSAAFAGPSAEARYGSGTFTVANTSLKEYGCFYHPYTVNLNIGTETYDWDAEIRVLAPNGTVAEFDFIDGVGVGAGSLPEEIFFCSSLDPAGTYTITGTLSTYESYYDYTPTDVALAPVAFTVSPYVAPTPPPPPAPVPAPAPAPAPVVYADVTGKVSVKSVANGAKLTFKSNALPSGATQRKALSWKVIADGKVKKTFSQIPSTIRSLTVRFKDKTGRHVIKVQRNGKVVRTVRLIA